MTKPIEIAWRGQPAKHDFVAAATYLTLLFSEKDATGLVRRLRKAALTKYAARDVLRAAGVSLLGMADSDEERQKILAGTKISPLLLVRAPASDRVIVADGFHRLCTVFRLDDRAIVPCKII